MKETVTIVMATFNGAKFIEEQLQSFLRQSRLPDALIICDDKSTDTTCEIVNEFACKAPFKVKLYINNQNLGYNQNFSKALSLCNSDFVFISDQDDVWLEDKIYKVIEAFKKEPKKQLIIHDIEFCDEKLNLIGQTKLNRIKSFSDPIKGYVTGMATAIRTPFLKLCLPIPNKSYITYDNWLHNCAMILNVKHIIPEILALHRRHQNNATGENSLNVSFKTNKDYFKNDHKNSLKHNILSELTKNLIFFSEFANWVTSNFQVLLINNYTNDNHLCKLLKEFQTRINRNKGRLDIINLNRRNRIIPVFRFLINGGYEDFNGINSAIKDLFTENLENK